MSCYGWEAGTVVIPSKAWAAFRKDLITAWNAKQDELFDTAKRAHTAAKADAKGKRGENRDKAIKASIARSAGGRMDEWGDFRGSESAQDRYEALCGLIYKYDWKTRTSTLSAPKKADLAKLAVSKGGTVRMPEASVTFDNARHAIHWDVPENNRSVERAHEHWFARKLFDALSRVEWVRGSGGQIVGNDEYHRDSREAGCGGNYVNYDFHKKTAAEKKAEAAARRSSYGRSYYGRSYYW